LPGKVTFPRNPRSTCSSAEFKSNDGADTVVMIADIEMKKSNTRQKLHLTINIYAVDLIKSNSRIA